MARAKGNSIFSGYSGRLGSIDRTVGRDGGLSLNLINAGKDTILGVKSLMPQTKSPGRQARSTAYCACDEKYRLLSEVCRLNMQAYQIAFGTREEKTLTPFQFFMKLCLKSNLCDFIDWSGCSIEVTPPCPAPDLVGSTWVDAAFPDEIHYGAHYGGLYAQDTAEFEYVLIEFNKTIGNRTLNAFFASCYPGLRGFKIYQVEPFDVETVTWNNAPSKLFELVEFAPLAYSWNAIPLTGAGKYISINPTPNPDWSYGTFYTEFESVGEFAPYIS